MLFGFFGGLALFLYGLSLLSSSMQRAAGSRVKNLLKRFTSSPIKGVFVGFATTGIVQSSSITTVTVVSLINSGIMTLRQSVGVIFGAEIGTTVTAQMIAFPVGKFGLPIIAVGTLLYFLEKRNNGYVGQILFGFGLLFLGMETMKSGVAPLRESEFFLGMLVKFGAIPVLGVLASALFTAVIQSSSASTAIIIAMSQEGVISLNSAIPLIMGANMGTCITALLASYGATKSAKRAAFIHFMFNSLGVLLFLPFISFFTGLVSMTSVDLPRQIANAHTIFNVTNTLVFLPLIPIFLYVSKKIVPGEEIAVDGGVKYLDNNFLRVPSIALDSVEKEVNRMAKISFEMVKNSRKILLDNELSLIKKLYRNEEVVDNLLQAIGIYSIKLSQQEMSKKEASRLSALMHNITDIERVADHAVNLVALAKEKSKEKVKFSGKAREEINIMFENSRLIYQTAITVVRTKNRKLVKKVMKFEDVIDANEKEFEHKHIARLKRNVCNPAAGIIFTDILHNLERIGDHSVNLVDWID